MMRAKPKGFMATLFDLSFTEHVTSKLIRGLYRVVIVITVNAVMCAWLITYWLPEWIGWGIKLLMYVSAPSAALVGLSITRIILEYLFIIFAIDAKLSILTTHTGHPRKETLQP